MISFFSKAIHWIYLIGVVAGTLNLIAYFSSNDLELLASNQYFPTWKQSGGHGEVPVDPPKSRNLADNCEMEGVRIEIINIKIEDYKRKLAALSSSINMQVVIAMIAIAAALKLSQQKGLGGDGEDHQQVKTPVIDIPISAVLVSVPVLSLLAWMQFGYLLSNVIESRFALWQLTSELARLTGLDAVTGGSGQGGEPLNSLEYRTYALRSTLNDGGFVDCWFRVFHPSFVEGVPSAPLNRIGVLIAGAVVFGGIFGANHAAAIFLAHRGMQLKGSPVPWWAYCVQFWVIVSLYFFSHVAFFAAGQNENVLHCAIFGGMTIILFGLTRLCATTETDVPPSKPCQPAPAAGGLDPSKPPVSAGSL